MHGSRVRRVEIWKERAASSCLGTGGKRRMSEVVSSEVDVAVTSGATLVKRQPSFSQIQMKSVDPEEVLDDPVASVVGLNEGLGYGSTEYDKLGSHFDPLLLCNEVGQREESGALGDPKKADIVTSGPDLLVDERLEEVVSEMEGGPPLVDGPYNVQVSSDPLALVNNEPNLVPPDGFKWKFLAGTWAMVPALAGLVDGLSSEVHVDSMGGIKDTDCSEGQLVDKVNLDSDPDCDDSFAEFESNLRVLLPNLPSGVQNSSEDLGMGTRKSGRVKKPSSRFNEEAGYLPEPPRSAKKKGIGGDNSGGTQA